MFPGEKRMICKFLTGDRTSPPLPPPCHLVPTAIEMNEVYFHAKKRWRVCGREEVGPQQQQEIGIFI